MGKTVATFLNGQACDTRDGTCLAYAAGFQGIMCDQGMTSNQLICFAFKGVIKAKKIWFSHNWLCFI